MLGRARAELAPQFAEGLQVTRPRVNLDGVHVRKQRAHGLERRRLLLRAQPVVGADGQATTAAVAALSDDTQDALVDAEGGRRTDLLAWPVAVQGAVALVDNRLAEVQVVVPVLHAHHQPWARGRGADHRGDLGGRGEAAMHRTEYRRVRREVDAVRAREGEDRHEVANGRQVLVGRAADQLVPRARMQRRKRVGRAGRNEGPHAAQRRRERRRRAAR
mmetsp:Transcript_32873/g.81704  ORF Transcript_32873/g.81704 Transcript_32873/m.81704 type:complete len:218 (+) Transcript_32873:568-1221(+)